MTILESTKDLIQSLDMCLNMARKSWIEAKGKIKKDKCMERIDDMLIQRFALMKKRDAIINAKVQ